MSAKDDTTVPETTIPVKSWMPWIKSDHIVGHPQPLYRRDLKPAERSDFDEKMAQRHSAEQKRQAKLRRAARVPKEQPKPKPPEGDGGQV